MIGTSERRQAEPVLDSSPNFVLHFYVEFIENWLIYASSNFKYYTINLRSKN